MDIIHNLIVHAPPPKVYAALTEPAQLAVWFADEVEGETAHVGAEAGFHFRQGVIRVQITELVPNQKIVWKILQGLPGWEGITGEWSWVLSTPYPGTMILFTHSGWPSMEGAYPSTNHKIGSLIDRMRALVESSEAEPA
jgi:uncharacterized protein YndB with AHSA1/START domain